MEPSPIDLPVPLNTQGPLFYLASLTHVLQQFFPPGPVRSTGPFFVCNRYQGPASGAGVFPTGVAGRQRLPEQIVTAIKPFLKSPQMTVTEPREYCMMEVVINFHGGTL